jgi:hypothetical protein
MLDSITNKANLVGHLAKIKCIAKAEHAKSIERGPILDIKCMQRYHSIRREQVYMIAAKTDLTCINLVLCIIVTKLDNRNSNCIRDTLKI